MIIRGGTIWGKGVTMECKERSSIRCSDSKEESKRPYAKPKLIVFGNAQKITREIGVSPTDGYAGSQLGDLPASDRNAKESFAPVDRRDILERLVVLPIERWNYKGESPWVRHIGPMAQDFARAFGVGGDDKRIYTVDAFGVALASIQALYWLLKERDSKMDELRRGVEELKAEMEEARKEPTAY